MKLRGDPAYQEHLGNFTSHKAKRASAVKQRAGAIGSRKRKAVDYVALNAELKREQKQAKAQQ